MTREEWQQQKARQVKDDMRRIDLLMIIHNNPAFTFDVLKQFIVVKSRQRKPLNPGL
jgi:hypothetical protein